MLSARDRMNIIAAYQMVGTYRGAAQMCGVTHKTVRRVIERAQAGEPAAAPQACPPMLWITLCATDGDRPAGRAESRCQEPCCQNGQGNPGDPAAPG